MPEHRMISLTTIEARRLTRAIAIARAHLADYRDETGDDGLAEYLDRIARILKCDEELAHVESRLCRRIDQAEGLTP